MGPRFTLGLLAVILLAVGIGLLAARSQPSTTAAPAPTSTPTPLPTPAVDHVNIEVNPTGNPPARYDPSTLRVRVGEKVTWVNIDATDHTATAENGAFNTGVLGTGESKSWTPKKPGRYSYGSFLQPDMRGVVVVGP